MPLTNADQKFWAPVPNVVDRLVRQIPSGAKVLDVGPGHSPFRRADVSVDFVDAPGAANQVKCDFGLEPLPFGDKSFDFVYCRHTLEDMFNPFHVLSEMSRVGKAGYIETPSPICEMTRGVDGGSPHYRGYHHHRFFVWNDGGALQFLSKYPVVEYLSDGPYETKLKGGPKYWNTYFMWSGTLRWKHWQNPLDFGFMEGYARLLDTACAVSKTETDLFWSMHEDT